MPQADLFDEPAPIVDVTSEFETSPKLDLHRHLLGSLTAADVESLVGEHDIPISREALNKLATLLALRIPVAGLKEFFRPWSSLSKLLVSPQVVETIAYRALKQARLDNVVYVEFRASWGMNYQETFDVDAFLSAIHAGFTRGERDFGVTGRLILGITRHLFARHIPSIRKSLWSSILTAAVRHREKPVVGFDLSGVEEGYSATLFEPELTSAKAEGFQITIHSGETGDASELRSAIERLEPDRIGHGLAAASDAALIELLMNKDIAIEACPTSNWLTRTVPNLRKHPLREFHRRGVAVTLNTDNPGICGTSLSHEHALVVQYMGLPRESLHTFTQNSLRHMFCNADLRRQIEKRWFSGPKTGLIH